MQPRHPRCKQRCALLTAGIRKALRKPLSIHRLDARLRGHDEGEMNAVFFDFGRKIA
jgi:hypothetical protein